MPEELEQRLVRAVDARSALVDDQRHESAFRLFNGFSEGCADLAVDLYGRTLVLHNHAAPPKAGELTVDAALQILRKRLPWLRAAIVKARNGTDAHDRRGRIAFGAEPDQVVIEGGVLYALDLTLNRDASLYLDTRLLRAWLLENARGKTVLNTFAYTGSLGVAAKAGGAAEVVQLDRSEKFLRLARASCALNDLPVTDREFCVGDFFAQISRFKRAGKRFDYAIIDPPFFSANSRAVVDLASDSARLINKVRPLINDGGKLVAINNALFLSGRAYLEALNALCADGYLAIETLLPVPNDFVGYEGTRVGAPITDPAPFNHSTKIAVLSVRRKNP